MVSAFTHKQVGGRRAGETPEFRFSWVKTIVSILTAVAGAMVIGWATYVTYGAIDGKAAWIKLNKIELQMNEAHQRMNNVLHNRISNEIKDVHDEMSRKYDHMIDIALDIKQEADAK